MNSLLSLLLMLSLLLSCTGCVGQAAPVLPDNAALSGQKPEEPENLPPVQDAVLPPEEEEEPEEPYVRIIDPAGPMVALTFDDGPHEVYSHQILDILEENHAVATFFEVGYNIPNCPDALARMVELGCEVGSHSNSHRDLSSLKKNAVLQDLAAADEAFRAAANITPFLLRPPYGAVNKMVKSGTGRSVITWTVDTEDWLSQDAQTVIDYVQGLSSLDGEIVLMHSTYESTVAAVRVLIPWLIEQGYQLVTVSELMAYYYGELLAPNQFYGYTYFTTHGRTDSPLELPSEPMEIQIPEPAPEEAAPPPAQTPVQPVPQPAAPPEEAVPEETPPPSAGETPDASEETPDAPAEAPPAAEEPALPEEQEPAPPVDMGPESPPPDAPPAGEGPGGEVQPPLEDEAPAA